MFCSKWSFNTSCFISDNQPGPPTNVVALARSPSSILVTWNPPDGHYQIIGYTVHYNKPGGARNEEKQNTVEGDVYSNIVTNLQPFTNYSFYVKALTKGIGLDSKVITQQTKQGSKLIPTIRSCGWYKSHFTNHNYILQVTGLWNGFSLF